MKRLSATCLGLVLASTVTLSGCGSSGSDSAGPGGGGSSAVARTDDQGRSGSSEPQPEESLIPGQVAVPADCADSRLAANLSFAQYSEISGDPDPYSNGVLANVVDATPVGGQAKFAQAACAALAAERSANPVSAEAGKALDQEGATLEYGYGFVCALGDPKGRFGGPGSSAPASLEGLQGSISADMRETPGYMDSSNQDGMLNRLLASDQAVSLGRTEPAIAAAYKYLCPQFTRYQTGPSLKEELAKQSDLLKQAKKLNICGAAILDRTRGYVYYPANVVDSCEAASKVLVDSYPTIESPNALTPYRGKYSCSKSDAETEQASGIAYRCADDRGTIAWRRALFIASPSGG